MSELNNTDKSFIGAMQSFRNSIENDISLFEDQECPAKYKAEVARALRDRLEQEKYRIEDYIKKKRLKEND